MKILVVTVSLRGIILKYKPNNSFIRAILKSAEKKQTIRLEIYHLERIDGVCHSHVSLVMAPGPYLAPF